MKGFKEKLIKDLMGQRSDGLTRKLGKDNRINIKAFRQRYIDFLEEAEELRVGKLIWREGDVRSFEQLAYEFDLNRLPFNFTYEFRPQMVFAKGRILVRGLHVFKMSKKSEEYFGSEPYFLGGLQHFQKIKDVKMDGICFNLYYTIQDKGQKADARLTVYWIDGVLWFYDFANRKFEVVNYGLYQLLTEILANPEIPLGEFKEKASQAKDDMGFLALAVVIIRRMVYSYFTQKSLAPMRETYAHIERGKPSEPILVKPIKCVHCDNLVPSTYKGQKCYYGSHKLKEKIEPLVILVKKQI